MLCFLFATANSLRAKRSLFSKQKRVTNIFQFFPSHPQSGRHRVPLHYEKDPVGAAIFVRYNKHSNLLFASVQRTFAANSCSVEQMEQTFNKNLAVFTVLNGHLVLWPSQYTLHQHRSGATCTNIVALGK